MAPSISPRHPVMDLAGRPGGRSARIRAAVHAAVLDLVAEERPEGLTIPVIAARAGVHPTTVYRRWGSVGDLLAAVAASRFAGDLVVPDTGSLHGDLVRWVTDVATDLTDPDTVAVIRAAVGAGGERGGRACIADREAQVSAVLKRESARNGGDLAVQDVCGALLGPLYYRVVFAGLPIEAGEPQRLVERLLGTQPQG